MLNINTNDILDRWVEGEPPLATDTILVTITADAVTILLSMFPDLEDRVNNGSLDIQIVKIVVSAMVQRAYVDGVSNKASYSQTTGPFSESGSWSTGNDQKGLYLTPQEMKLLRDKAKASGMFMINLYKGKPNFPITPAADAKAYNYFNQNYGLGAG